VSKARQVQKPNSYPTGGFEQSSTYQELLADGQLAVTFILEEMQIGRSERWKIQMACEIAERMGKPVEFSDVETTDFDMVTNRIVEWGIENNLVEDLSSSS
jgi:hypothetical protein